MPLVMVTRVATFEQAPVAAKLTAPVPLPPEELTVKDAFSTCAVPGMPVTDKAAWLVRVSVATVRTPAAVAKYVELIFVAPEVLPPQVPLTQPRPPSVRVPVLRLAPKLAVAGPTMLKFPLTPVEVTMDFAPPPENLRFW